MAIIRFSAMGAKVIRNVAVERLKAAAEQMPNRNDPVRRSQHGLTTCQSTCAAVAELRLPIYH